MEKTNVKTYDEKQIKDARQFCGILQTVPVERRNIFITIANASAFVLSEIADICEKDSDTTLKGMTPEKFAEAAADSLTQAFKDIFNK